MRRLSRPGGLRPSRLRGRISGTDRLGSFRGRGRDVGVESLESRQLLSTFAGPMPPAEVGQSVASTVFGLPTPVAYTPSQMRQAYGFNSISFQSHGQTIPGSGAGQTIAIVDAYNDATIKSDLAVFDTQFGLAPPPSFKVVNQSGGAQLPADSTSGLALAWAGETALDVEWAHAIAPAANILLVEATTQSPGDLLVAARYASTVQGVIAVSMSFGYPEYIIQSSFANEPTLDPAFNVAGVTFVAATGDTGGIEGADWPSVSQNVLAIGGTNLSLSLNGTYVGETSWTGSAFGGGGGGTSRYEPTPFYQKNASIGALTMRSVPDVSYNGDPATGVYTYNHGSWGVVGGTSAGAPQWSALMAIVAQGRALNGLTQLSSPQTLSLIYGLASTDYQATPSPYFHDIVSGYNAFYTAKRGYDLVTGLGTPKANALVAYLASAASPTIPGASTLFTGPIAPPPGGSTRLPLGTPSGSTKAPIFVATSGGVVAAASASALANALVVPGGSFAPASSSSPAQAIAPASLGSGSQANAPAPAFVPASLFGQSLPSSSSPATATHGGLEPTSPTRFAEPLVEEPNLTSAPVARVLPPAPAAIAPPLPPAVLPIDPNAIDPNLLDLPAQPGISAEGVDALTQSASASGQGLLAIAGVVAWGAWNLRPRASEPQRRRPRFLVVDLDGRPLDA